MMNIDWVLPAVACVFAVGVAGGLIWLGMYIYRAGVADGRELARVAWQLARNEDPLEERVPALSEPSQDNTI